jgi:aspartokinase/homoserine dehydrogenase 1
MIKSLFQCLFFFFPFLSSATVGIHTDVIPIKTVNVFLVGTGVVGGSLLEQIKLNQHALHERYGVNINVIGLANSKTMMFNPEGINLNDWRNQLKDAPDQMNLGKFLDHMLNTSQQKIVFIDCTADQAIANAYMHLLSSNISIITPNKKANSGPINEYLKLQGFCTRTNVKYLYDSNAGAGLPIISTIKGLQKGGDKIIKIEAILSGTLSYLFNTFEEDGLFSKLVHDAQRKGYTEPDPRDDLTGMDVARKLLILSRESGYKTEISDITLTGFLPEECFDVDNVEQFYAKLSAYDDFFTEKIKKANANQKKLRFIATFENGKGLLSLQEVDKTHPFYHLTGNDNMVIITTNFYNTNPLIIKGPGAGAEVTAAKLLEGIVRIGLEI